jgi:hypothetical protein
MFASTLLSLTFHETSNIVKINYVQDNGIKFNSLLTAISAYAEGFSADPIIRRAFRLWEKLDSR